MVPLAGCKLPRQERISAYGLRDSLFQPRVCSERPEVECSGGVEYEWAHSAPEIGPNFEILAFHSAKHAIRTYNIHAVGRSNSAWGGGEAFRRYFRRLRSHLNWLVLAIGVAAVYFFFVTLPRIGVERSGEPYLTPSPWVDNLVGRRIQFPRKDSQGFLVPESSRLFLVTLGCTFCSVHAGIDRVLEKASYKPVILVVNDELRHVPKELLNRPGEFLIICDKAGKCAPLDMLNFPPQAAVVSDGRIISAPSEGVSLAEFLSRGSL